MTPQDGDEKKRVQCGALAIFHTTALLPASLFSTGNQGFPSAAQYAPPGWHCTVSNHFEPWMTKDSSDA